MQGYAFEKATMEEVNPFASPQTTWEPAPGAHAESPRDIQRLAARIRLWVAGLAVAAFVAGALFVNACLLSLFRFVDDWWTYFQGWLSVALFGTLSFSVFFVPAWLAFRYSRLLGSFARNGRDDDLLKVVQGGHRMWRYAGVGLLIALFLLAAPIAAQLLPPFTR